MGLWDTIWVFDTSLYLELFAKHMHLMGGIEKKWWKWTIPNTTIRKLSEHRKIAILSCISILRNGEKNCLKVSMESSFAFP